MEAENMSKEKKEEKKENTEEVAEKQARLSEKAILEFF